MLYLEGIYNQDNRMMYVIGCRDLRASLVSSTYDESVEDGYDCLIEVSIEYPPTNAMWLINPTAKVLITSQRKHADTLYFDQIKFKTLSIVYQKQWKEMHFWSDFEVVLQIFSLSVVIFCILSQLIYVKKNTNKASYVSLVMLGSLALGFSIPMIT
ncbi:hypothetical protein DsansV1_C11g0113181 [Dioscorea sansibarensis]